MWVHPKHFGEHAGHTELFTRVELSGQGVMGDRRYGDAQQRDSCQQEIVHVALCHSRLQSKNGVAIREFAVLRFIACQWLQRIIGSLALASSAALLLRS